MKKEIWHILFICLGNICRSPLAAGIMKSKLKNAGISNIEVNSAALGSWHIGGQADPRSISTAAKYGIDITSHRVSQVSIEKIMQNDLILGMDQENLRQLIQITENAFPNNPQKAQSLKNKISLVRDYEDISPNSPLNSIDSNKIPNKLIVPDPYYGSIADFEKAYRILDHALNGLLNYLVDSLLKKN